MPIKNQKSVKRNKAVQAVVDLLPETQPLLKFYGFGQKRTHAAIANQLLWGIQRNQQIINGRSFFRSYIICRYFALKSGLITYNDLPNYVLTEYQKKNRKAS